MTVNAPHQRTRNQGADRLAAYSSTSNVPARRRFFPLPAGLLPLGVQNNNNIRGNHVSVYGNRNTVDGPSALVEGNQNNVSGSFPKVNGHSNVVHGNNASVRGNSNRVSGRFTSAYGDRNRVTGEYASATGLENQVEHQGLPLLDQREQAHDFLRQVQQHAMQQLRQQQELLANMFPRRLNRHAAAAAAAAAAATALAADASASVAVPAEELVEVPGEEELQFDERIDEDDVEAPCCVICREQVPICVAMPCMHMAYCVACARRLCTDNHTGQPKPKGQVECCKCRKSVHAMRRVFVES